MTEKAYCAICHKPCGDRPHAGNMYKVYHMACAMEQSCAARGLNPSKGVDADEYAKECKKREIQVNS